MRTWNPNKPSSSLIINPNHKTNKTTSPYKEITLIEPKDISPLNPNTSAFSCFFGGDLVGQRYFQIQGDRKYFVSVWDPSSKQQWKREVPKINFNAITARRLMVEVVDFIEDMVIVGACIDKPLHQFLLVSYEKGKQKIKMMRLPSKNQKQQIIQLDQQTTVEQRWLVMLKNFYMFLFTMIQNQSEIAEYTFESINQTKLLEQLNKKSTKISILKKLLLTYQFKCQQKGYQYMFRCCFDPKEYILQASITNLSRQYSVYFRQEEQIPIKDAKNLNLSAFFYLTSMLPLQQLRINSSESISFYDQTRSEWVQVRLAKYYPTSPQVDQKWLYEKQKYRYSSDMAQYQIEENDVQFGTVREMRIQGQLSSQYPYNCICLIQAHYKYKKGDMVVRGVGSLITRQLVLTNAHVIFYRNPLNGQRDKPYKINAIFMDKNIKVTNWIISPNYYHEQLPHDLRFRRQYDLGLLQLETSPLSDNLPLQLATDYESEEQLLFPKLIKDYQQRVARVELFHSEEEVNIVNRKIFMHSLVTQLGDSGTPIIIQRCPQLLPKFLIVSIHSSSLQLEGMKQRKKSIKINKQTIYELVHLQKLLNPQLIDSKILLGTSSYKDRPNADALKYQVEIQQLRKEAVKFIKICIMKQYHRRNPHIEWSVSQVERILYAARFIEYCKKQQPNLSVNILKLVLLSLLYHQKFQLNKDGLHPVLATLQYYRKFQQTTDQVMNMDPLLFYYRIKLLKLKNYQPQIPNSILYEVKIVKFTFYLKAFDQKFFDRIMKVLGLKVTSKELRFDLVYQQHIPQIIQVHNLPKSPFQIKEPLLSQGLSLPFTSFSCQGKINSLKIYSFKYVLNIKQRKQLDNLFWQLLLVEHENMLILTPLRVMTQDKELSYLEVGFWAMYNTTIQSALLHKIMPIGQWLLLMIDVVSFVMFLHGRGFILGAPIETCLLINFKHKPVFFYFSHPSILKSSINNSDKRQRLYLHEYYPFLQISKAGNTQQSFKQIDVWMLGLSFTRIFHRLFMNPKQNWSNGKEIVKDVIGQLLKRMKCPVEERIHLEEVRDQLENIKKICQEIGGYF